jgi:hypothetical protein
MRQYVGHKMKFVVEGFPSPFTGTMVNEDTQLVYLKSEKDEIWHLPKGKICGFVCLDGEPEGFLPFLVLSCDCKNIGCLGVQYIKAGPGFNQKDLEAFTDSCPCKNPECRIGSKGELRGVSSSLLKKMFNGMLFGDYPEKKKEAKRANRSGQSVTTAESGETEGGRIVEGEEPVDGGIGQSPEASV